jgi:hypothetical protein
MSWGIESGQAQLFTEEKHRAILVSKPELCLKLNPQDELRGKLQAGAFLSCMAGCRVVFFHSVPAPEERLEEGRL